MSLTIRVCTTAFIKPSVSGFFQLARDINSADERCRRLARRRRGLVARPQIDTLSPIVRRGGHSATALWIRCFPG